MCHAARPLYFRRDIAFFVFSLVGLKYNNHGVHVKVGRSRWSGGSRAIALGEALAVSFRGDKRKRERGSTRKCSLVGE